MCDTNDNNKATRNVKAGFKLFEILCTENYPYFVDLKCPSFFLMEWCDFGILFLRICFNGFEVDMNYINFLNLFIKYLIIHARYIYIYIL